MTHRGNIRPPAECIHGTVASGVVRGFVEFAASRGVDERALLHSCEVRRATLDDADARIPLRSYVSLVHLAQRRLGCDALALQFGATMSLSSLSVVGLLSDAAPTMRESLACLNRYASLLTDFGEHDDSTPVAAGDRFRVSVRGAHSWLVDHRPLVPGFPEQVEITFAFIATVMRRYARHAHDRFVHEVQVVHPPPGSLAEYERIFEVPVHFGQPWNALRIDATWLDRPLALQPAWAGAILEAHAEQQLRRLRAERTIGGRVSALLQEALEAPGGAEGWGRMPDIEAVARALHMSPATLSRRLRTEGTTFSAVVAECRRALAEAFLVRHRASVKETAFRLGFSDPAAFSRAYKRWTGTPPTEAARPS